VYVERNFDRVFDEYKALKYAYARLSTDDQNAALKRHGCKNIFTDDGLSGAMSIESRRACPELVERGRLNLSPVQISFEDASVQQPLFPCGDPLLVVIPSEASGSAVRHSCASLLQAHNRHQSSPNPHGNTNLPFVIPGFQGWSAEPQIPPRHAGAGQVGSLPADFLLSLAAVEDR
jgi:hypothetical protein